MAELRVPVVIDSECIKKVAEEIKRECVPRSVIEDIKAEIEGSITDGNIYAENNGLFKALDIIDRHIGKEKEDAETRP